MENELTCSDGILKIGSVQLNYGDTASRDDVANMDISPCFGTLIVEGIKGSIIQDGIWTPLEELPFYKVLKSIVPNEKQGIINDDLGFGAVIFSTTDVRFIETSLKDKEGMSRNIFIMNDINRQVEMVVNMEECKGQSAPEKKQGMFDLDEDYLEYAKVKMSNPKDWKDGVPYNVYGTSIVVEQMPDRLRTKDGLEISDESMKTVNIFRVLKMPENKFMFSGRHADIQEGDFVVFGAAQCKTVPHGLSDDCNVLLTDIRYVDGEYPNLSEEFKNNG